MPIDTDRASHAHRSRTFTHFNNRPVSQSYESIRKDHVDRFYIPDVDLNKSYTVALFGFNQIAVIDPETPPECLKAYSPEILNNALQQLATDRQEITRDERQLVKMLRDDYDALICSDLEGAAYVYHETMLKCQVLEFYVLLMNRSSIDVILPFDMSGRYAKREAA